MGREKEKFSRHKSVGGQHADRRASGLNPSLVNFTISPPCLDFFRNE